MEETGRKLFAIDLDYVSQTQKFDGNNKIGRKKMKLTLDVEHLTFGTAISMNTISGYIMLK